MINLTSSSKPKALEIQEIQTELLDDLNQAVPERGEIIPNPIAKFPFSISVIVSKKQSHERPQTLFS